MLLTLTLLAFFYLIFTTRFYTTAVLIAGFALIQVSLLIHYINKTNRYVKNFLEAIKYSEFTRSFEFEGLGTSFDGMKEAFNTVIAEFQKIRNEKEEQFHFLQNVIQHIGISMIAFQEDGKVEMLNNATKKLFNRNNIRNINELENLSHELVNTFHQLKSGEKSLLKINLQNDILQLAIYAKEFKLRGQVITLVSIQNIQTELEEQEMEAWQKLIRVLTHEIMNSITPIASLSSTVSQMVKVTREDPNLVVPAEMEETISDIENALVTINKRSNGLLHFVETYRNLTRIPKPNFKIFEVKTLFHNIHLLMEEELKLHNITMQMSIQPENFELFADEELIEQVMINLVKNASHALENQDGAHISLKAVINERGEKLIQVIDNGPGIVKDVLDKIFIPFFTTKKEGSGIGLALSRQILRLHGGSIMAHSEPGVQTIFTLRF